MFNSEASPSQSTQTNSATEQFASFTADDIVFPSGGPAAAFAGLQIESLGAGIHEPDEPAAADDDDDGGWVPEHGAPAFGRLHGGQAPAQDELAEDDDAAPPIAPNAPDEGDDGGQVLAQYAPVDAPAVTAGVVDQRTAENEQYLDRSVDPEALSIPLIVFPKLNRVIPQRESNYAGWSAFISAVAPTPAPVVVEKKDVPYVIGGTLQEAPLSEAARKELRRIGKDAETGKARSNKHILSLGPGLLLDDDGDVLAREAVLRALGCAACIYTSHSYGTIKKGAVEASKGGRVLLCLNREYSPDEHQLLWDGINHLLGGGFDKAGRTLSQCYGMHARRSTDAPSRRIVIDGAALNVDVLVALGRQPTAGEKRSSGCGKAGKPTGPSRDDRTNPLRRGVSVWLLWTNTLRCSSMSPTG